MRLNREHPKFAQQANNPVPRLAWSLREFAQALGVHYATVHRMVQRGLLGVIRDGPRRFLISTQEVERFLREHTTFKPKPGRKARKPEAAP